MPPPLSMGLFSSATTTSFIVSTENLQNKHREIKSFVLRQGRLTVSQQNALENHWQDYGIDFSK